MERKAGERAEAAAGPALTLAAEGAGGVLEHGHPVRQLLDPHRPAEEVNRDDRLRPRADLDLCRVEIHRLGIDVDEHGLRPDEGDDVRGRGKRVGRDQHLVAGPDPEREHGEVQRRCAG